MRLAKFFLILCLLIDGLFSMESFEAVDGGLLSSKVVFAEGSSNQFKTLFRGFIKKINANPIGNKLFDVLRTLLTEAGEKNINVSYLIVKDVTEDGNRRTSFEHGLNFEEDETIAKGLMRIVGGKLYLCVNLGNAVRCYSVPCANGDSEHFFSVSECIYKKVDLSSCITSLKKYIPAEYRNKETTIPANTFAYPVSEVYLPFYVTIVHEFIHFKHFLEACLGKTMGVSLEKAAVVHTYDKWQNCKELKELTTQMPELSEIDLFTEKFTKGNTKNTNNLSSLLSLRRAIPWDKFEERRTVCGPDIDKISEVAFCIAEGLPVRYIYQGHAFFLEDSNIAEKIIGQVVADVNEILKKREIKEEIKLKDVLDSLPDNYDPTAMKVDSFNAWLACSPFTIRLLLFNDNGLMKYANVSQKNKNAVCNVLKEYRAKYLSKDVNKILSQ